MANIFDKFLNSMRLYDEEEIEDDVEYLDDEVEEEEEELPSRAERERERERERAERAERAERTERAERAAAERSERPTKRSRVEEAEEEIPQPRQPRSSGRRSNVTAMRQAPARGASVMEVSMVKPNSMEDARDICDMLLSGRAVVINMEGVHVELAQRIIDFASGACYSIEGNLQKISSYIFIISPNNIELSGDFQNVINSVSGSNLRLDG